MSRILKRPMFRIGGSTNEGIMSSVVPKRAGYASPTGEATTSDNYQLNPNDPLYKDALRRAAIMSQFAGSGRSRDDRLSDLLISGGLNLMSAKPTGNIFSTAASAFKEPTSQFLKGSADEESFQRQLRLAGLTSAMQAEENKAKYEKELEIANKKLEQGEKELFIKTSGLQNASTIYDVKRALEKKGEKIYGAVTIEGSGPKAKPVIQDVLTIPEGSVFYDTSGKFYKRVKEGPGWKRLEYSGQDIKVEAPIKKSGFFESSKEIGAAYDPRAWNKQRFYEELAKKKSSSNME